MRYYIEELIRSSIAPPYPRLCPHHASPRVLLVQGCRLLLSRMPETRLGRASQTCLSKRSGTSHRYVLTGQAVLFINLTASQPECQINGAWLSYECRRKYLHWVKMLYTRCAISLPHPSKNHELFVARQIFHTDGFNIPSKLTPYTPDEFMESSILAGLFNDERSQAMIQELREAADQNTYLMTAGFRYGQYFIVLMSKFYFYRHALRRDGTEVKPTVVLLNGYVHLRGPYGKDRG